MRTESSSHLTRRATIAASFGTVVEWYDFFLYGTASALIFPSLFFPSANSLTGSLLSFATFATGFVARPLGGAIFGHVGDRIGRKNALVVTLLAMGLATLAVGLLPTYGQIGAAAPILLVVLRIVQGIGTGGEWGGAALLTKENGSTRPGFWGGFLSSAVFAGLILASVVYVVIGALVSNDQLLSWAWRIPFLLSVVLVGLGLWMRKSLPETREFDRIKRAGEQERAPLLRAFRKPRNMVAIFLMRVGQNATFNIVSVFVLTYATKQLGLGKSQILWATVIGAAVACVLCPVYGHLGDRFGFGWVMVVSLLFQAAFAFPFFLLVDSKGVAPVIIAVTVGIAGAGAATDAIQAGYFAGLFGTRSRYSAISVGREGGTVVGGGLAPLIATALLGWLHGSPWAIAGWMALTSVIGVVGVLLVKPLREAEPEDVVPSAGPRSGSAVS
ncbi:MFS transporter [Amycolatopsis sp. FDAARGOS 1241]|uniref:MFS transporter n=1 Tax=Amycolatopsis sp. FDAARGOS 1241 TaxID=2778070 RepID=UPI00194E7B30|nr:MFS transporter [Amycolatopsis sp. FDAARGOS 1241]QRP44771.1 MFS transporter [Amycolatopsis sp. FDAARGOS 1241]